jgi:alpha-glucosidase (family GH31 glycosyl hydrolase)
VGSHRYPIGFSGDTEITWKTLAYLPYFTATASNIGYTWWSHDIGGHNFGEKSNELYVSHLQYGVFSPINRLHCACDETMTKEPWFYGNGAGGIAENFLRFRHRLIPYLYNASYHTYALGEPIVQPLYYRWKEAEAYAYKTEYLFGEELLVLPVTEKMERDGFARIAAWVPMGEWTDIFTGDEYCIGAGGKEMTLLRDLESIPVFIKAGGVLPLSMDKGNSCKNPVHLEIWAFEGNGEYSLYEDGKESGIAGSVQTKFYSKFVERKGACTQSLTIKSGGDKKVIPKNRSLIVRFKNIPEGEVSLYVDAKKQRVERLYFDHAAARFAFDTDKTYKIVVRYQKESRLQKLLRRACDVLTRAEWENPPKEQAWRKISKATSVEEYIQAVDGADLSQTIKMRLKETL